MVRVGMEIPPLDIPSVSAEKMKTMAALLNDGTPIHFDVEAVRALGLGDRPINQGPTNMAYVMTMLCAWAGGYDRLRDFRVRFVGNVFARDTLRASGVVTAVRRVEGLTQIDCSVRLDIVNGANVLLGNATVHVNEALQP
jgi:acyl dehydratase